MKNKKIVYWSLLFLITFFCSFLQVKADLGGYLFESKEENKTLKAGDIVTVNIITGTNADNLILTGGSATIRWDSKVFELQIGDSLGDSLYSDLEGFTFEEASGCGASSGFCKIKFKIDEAKRKPLDKEAISYKVLEFQFKVKDNVISQESKIYAYEDENALSCLYEGQVLDECIYNFGNELMFKIDGLDSNSKLASLNISGVDLVPTFDSSTNSYASYVKNAIDKIQIEAKCSGKNCKIDGLGTKNLKVGSNNFVITVTSEAGTTSKYNLTIFREENPKSPINTLKSLEIGSENIEFDPDITSYQVIVDDSIKSISIKSELMDNKSKYVKDFGNRVVDLEKGLNEVLIKIEAENGSINTYKINIIRGQSEEELKKIANIDNLKIENHYIDFSSTKYSYVVEIAPEEKKLNFDITLLGKGTTYEVLNNENLAAGKKVIVRVTSGDKSVTNDYEFMIEENSSSEFESDNSSNSFTNLIIVILAILLAAAIIYIIVDKNKKN